jgi:signal transduction histidine kinase
MEDVGGVLTIGLENVVLDKAAVKAYEDLGEGRYIELTVSDTGKGIDPRDIDPIFDPYFTTKAIGQGSGMGLAVASQPRKGATFTILLPLTGDPPADGI